MECSVCHKEFGNGGYCQNCGTDRIAGLANYHGFPPADNNGFGINYYNSRERMMECYACGKVIPADSKFCPVCSTELFVKCPKCGHEYSSQYPSCNQCGTNREQYLKEEKERQEQKAEEERIEEEKRLEAEKRWRESKEGKEAIAKKRDKEMREWTVKHCEDIYKEALLDTIVRRIAAAVGATFVGALIAWFLVSYHSNNMETFGLIVMVIVLCGLIFMFARIFDSRKEAIKETKKRIKIDLRNDDIDAEKKKYIKALYDQILEKEG